MTGVGLIGIYIFIMAAITGLELIKQVPTTLHTPLMSGSNAISGITIVGALMALSRGAEDEVTRALLFVGLVLATINVFGGYAVTNRMLKMFQKR